MHKPVFVAFVLAAFTAGAATADPAGWTHPSGAYSVQPEATGWSPLPGLGPDGEWAWELMGEERLVRMCFVRGRSTPIPGQLTEKQVNERARGFQPRIESAATRDVSVQTIDGVTVTSFVLESPRERMANHYRTFGLAQPGASVTYNEVSCGGVTPVSAEHEAAFNAFLNSLRFHIQVTQ